MRTANRDTSPSRVVIVDASNVANSAPSARPRLDYLRLLLTHLEREGFQAIAIADVGLGRRIDRPEEYQAMVAAGIVREAHEASSADPMILALAREMDAWIVSNDRFRQWIDRFPDAHERRIGFRIRDGKVELRGGPRGPG